MSTDAEIRQRCEAVLARIGRLARVRAEVDHGWVRLSGWVPRAADRWSIEEAVGRIDGATGVSAQISCAHAGAAAQ